MATTKKPNEEEVLLEEPGANPSLKINPTENYNKATATPYQAPTWNGGTGVAGQTEKLAQNVINMNYTDWTKGTDYASLTKRYSQQGQKAMDNTLGMVAARTGGLASSYATAAGNQAYNDYMTKLEDAARALYDSQRAEAKDNYGIAQGMYDRQYGEYVDDKNFGYQQYRDNVGDSQWADTMYGNQYNTEWNQDFQEGQYADSQTEGEAADLEETLYYAPDTYPDYASYKAANPNTRITEAQFNQIKAKAAGMYAENNKEWNYNTATKEEQDLYQAMYYSPDFYPDYASYMQANPNSTMTETKFNQIKATATGQFSQDNAGTQQSYLTQEEQNLDTTLYYSPDLYPDYASYKAANPNTQITEARFNEIRATALGRYENDNKQWNYATATDEETKLYNQLYANNGGMTYEQYKQQFPNSTMTEGTFNQILSTATGDYANDNKEWNYATANDEEQKLHDAIYANPDVYSNYTYDEYMQDFPDSTMTESSFNMIKSTAEGQYALDQQGRTEQNAQDEIYIQLQANPDAELDPELVEASGWSQATINAHRSHYQKLAADGISATEKTEKSENDTKMLNLVSSGLSWEKIASNPEYMEWMSSSNYGEDYWRQLADTSAVALAEQADAAADVAQYFANGGNLNTMPDDIRALAEKSGLTETQLRQMYENAGYSNANLQAQEQMLVQFSQGMFPENEADLWKLALSTGWDIATVNAYQSYYEDLENAKSNEESLKADSELMELVAAGMTWEQITAEYGTTAKKSTFGESYWKNKIRQYEENQNFTSSQLIAQDDLQTYLAAGTKLDPDKYAELVRKSGRSEGYWKAYAKLASGGEVTESDVSMLTDIEEIDIWTEAILGGNGEDGRAGAQTYEQAEMYATRLAQLDPELAAELLDEWERKHGYTSPDTTATNTTTGGNVGTGGAGVAGDPAIPKPFG